MSKLRKKRAPEYVATTYQFIGKRLIYSLRKQLTAEKKKKFSQELETVYNRGFSTGFYFGKPSSEDYAGIEGSKGPQPQKYIVGKCVLTILKNPKAAHILWNQVS